MMPDPSTPLRAVKPISRAFTVREAYLTVSVDHLTLHVS